MRLGVICTFSQIGSLEHCSKQANKEQKTDKEQKADKEQKEDKEQKAAKEQKANT